MTDYGKQFSSVEPKSVEIAGNMVYITSNVQPYSELQEGRQLTGYSYNCIGCTKDEYILLLSQINNTLEQRLIDTQLALCDLYEKIEGE